MNHLKKKRKRTHCLAILKTIQVWCTQFMQHLFNFSLNRTVEWFCKQTIRTNNWTVSKARMKIITHARRTEYPNDVIRAHTHTTRRKRK